MGKAWDLGVRTPYDLFKAVNSGQLGYEELTEEGKLIYDAAKRNYRPQASTPPVASSGYRDQDALLTALEPQNKTVGQKAIGLLRAGPNALAGANIEAEKASNAGISEWSAEGFKAGLEGFKRASPDKRITVTKNT